MKHLLVTGSSGLIGSEVCAFFHATGWKVHGLDNNQRAVFFGPKGETRSTQNRLQRELTNFEHHEIDIRDREKLTELFQSLQPDAIVHAAAQPSHDLAATMPVDDFEINAVGTLNLLEAASSHAPESPFVFLSTNKVYGDGPNRIRYRELETRWDYDDAHYSDGIDETFPIDQCLHSLFGASKTAADVLVQEYGRYFGMPTTCLRGGCLTGPNHSGVELHGFLSFLIRCNVSDQPYRIFGYGGKQVRDNIHSEDVARLIDEIIRAPRAGEVYNIGGGRKNSCSILEAFQLAEKYSGKKQTFSVLDEPRIGDHRCYLSNLAKVRSHYPDWDVKVSLEETMRIMVEAEMQRVASR